ncbi:MAG: succinate--CoA ligase subunit beta, partial [Gammaproteobacteria bacterium]|nr:succinate--CoA ligase subunit beta [Gammaproteobacteria bacterium]
DKNVKVIFVNIFGGIVRCDLIAEGIINAAKNIQNICPIVVRLQGNRADQAAAILSQSGLQIVAENDFLTAAKRAVELSQQ